MIGWIILGVIVYIIVGILIAALMVNTYLASEDESFIFVLFWPVVLCSLAFYCAYEACNKACRFVGKVIWRKKK